MSKWRETGATLKTVRAQFRLDKVFDLMNGGQWAEARQLASRIESDLELLEGEPPDLRELVELHRLFSRLVISLARDRPLGTQVEDVRVALESYIDGSAPSPTLVGQVELALRWAQDRELGHRRP